MFSPNQFKSFLLFALLACQSCSFWQSKPEDAPAPFSSEETVSDVPFSTKEPDIYQVEIVLTSYANGEKSVRKTFAARHGEKLRFDYESKISFVQQSVNERFLLHAGKKIYAESQAMNGFPEAANESLQSFLSSKWLGEKADARFERLGAEDDLTEYRVILGESQTSETLIFVDENFKIPVRQEFYSTAGAQRNLVFSIETRNLKLEAGDELFELPKDYKKVSADEFQKTVWREEFNW